ncbi:hypothetical protein [Arcanobacterium ihumii]|uniref:hypothetical protein n=1 Tax=Arcanobacterium ihumii TaxID=2138162 RepID=UPI000F546E81|nr:hypothetical protein [Arcanobacterium ihumii]
MNIFRFPRQRKTSDRSDSSDGLSVTDRVLDLLNEGKTVNQVASMTGTSEVFVKVMLDHWERIGLAKSAASLCSSGLGACGTSNSPLSMEAQIACAGCPLKLPKHLD